MCAVQTETVTHLESFPIMKQDTQRLYFNGERETEMKAADRCLSLLLPPFTIIDCAARLN